MIAQTVWRLFEAIHSFSGIRVGGFSYYHREIEICPGRIAGLGATVSEGIGIDYLDLWKALPLQQENQKIRWDRALVGRVGIETVKCQGVFDIDGFQQEYATWQKTLKDGGQ